MASSSSTLQSLRDPYSNKGIRFSTAERQVLGLHGQLPPAVRTKEQQIAIVMAALQRLDGGNELAKYEFLISLLDQDVELFYSVALKYTSQIMPLIYTPLVGAACTNWSHLTAPCVKLH
jgi:hypothetical protein